MGGKPIPATLCISNKPETIDNAEHKLQLIKNVDNLQTKTGETGTIKLQQFTCMWVERNSIFSIPLQEK